MEEGEGEGHSGHGGRQAGRRAGHPQATGSDDGSTGGAAWHGAVRGPGTGSRQSVAARAACFQRGRRRQRQPGAAARRACVLTGQHVEVEHGQGAQGQGAARQEAHPRALELVGRLHQRALAFGEQITLGVVVGAVLAGAAVEQLQGGQEGGGRGRRRRRGRANPLPGAAWLGLPSPLAVRGSWEVRTPLAGAPGWRCWLAAALT